MIPSYSVEPAAAADQPAIELMLDHAFGIARRAKTSYRLREGSKPSPGLSLVVRDEELGLQGAVSFWPVQIGEKGTSALLLGPLVVHWRRQNRGVGLALMRKGLALAREQGHHLIILVGDRPYYARVGFEQVPARRLILPGPVDPARFLYLELKAGALADAEGLVLPPYRHAELHRPSRSHASETSNSAAASAISEAKSG
jgi:predicted N-acetyltransferase YhbS